jgi:hypothetical protein
VLLVITSCFLASARAAASRASLLPPHHPARSLALDEHAQASCRGVRDHSATCLDESLAILNAGRRSEKLGPLVLPGNWSRLTVPEQTFVLTELERTARGLKPDSGLAADWNAAAQSGAEAGTDPTRAGAGARGGFLSIWAGGELNPILATVGWIYDDGTYPDGTTENIACSQASASGCWGHRDAILRDTAATACGSRCAVGAGYSPGGLSASEATQNRESYAEVFGIHAANNPDPLVFRWASELPRLPACERTGDSCSWNARPLWTTTGAVNVRGVVRGSSLVRPWFSVSTNWSSNSDGAVTLSVATGLALPTIAVTATQSGHRVALQVTRQGSGQFVAAGQLSSGRWSLTIQYGTPSVDGPRASTTENVAVP